MSDTYNCPPVCKKCGVCHRGPCLPKKESELAAMPCSVTLWRVCWKSRIGNIVRTRWKSHDAALEHFKKARLRSNHDVWMESQNVPDQRTASTKP